ncbi:MAG: hypothetical protein COB23_08555 [Methylophaga sp.]|nr:MAG: hypothetical protein COB23_08555 [Methylophaga sp.]
MRLSNLKMWVVVLVIFTSMTITAKDDSQYLLTEKTYKILNDTQQLMAVEQYEKAETKLRALLDKTASDSYDRAVVQQTLGYLYSSQQDYKKASSLFQQALDSNALPEKVSHNLQYNLAQLLMADEQYKAGISLLEAWLKDEVSPPNSVNVLLASAYYRVKNYSQTVTYIQLAINNDKSAKEAWYQILLSAHLELQQYQSAIKVLETLIPLYPYQKIYWGQLSALYLKQNKEFTALAVKMLAQRLELGDSKILVSLADMYRYLHIPYKSAQLLIKGMESGGVEANYKNLNRLADSWLAAQEGQKAADVLQQVAKLDDTGESDLKYGRVLFGLEQWQKATEPLLKSLQKLTGRKVGSAALLLGMAQFHAGQLAEAKVMFTKAVAFDNERNQAGQWLRHIERQLEEQTIEQS